MVSASNGTITTTLPNGLTDTVQQGADPRFGMLAPLAASRTTTTPGGLTLTSTASRTATLSDSNNLLSLTGRTDTVSVNGQSFKRTYNASTRTFTSTSAAGRQGSSTIDTLGRTVSSQTSGLAPAAYTYDSRGRLATVTVGTGADARTTTIAYNAGGLPATVTDSLGRSVGLDYDGAGRLISQTMPDGSIVAFEYDANGNLTSLTPPGRPAHVFAYTPTDRDSSYTPPRAEGSEGETRYTYNLDGQIERVTRPDGETLDFAYDSAGRLSTLTHADGVTTYSYSSQTANLSQITTSDGTTSAFTHDGPLPKTETWSGAVSGQVGYTHDHHFRVSSISVNGADPISYRYDADGLLTGAGDLTLTRDTRNGLLTGTTLGSITDALTYNTFGEVSTYTAATGGAALYSAQYARDKAGRITGKSESVDGTTTVYAYSYDEAGRLAQVQTNGSTTASYTYDGNGNRLGRTDSDGTATGVHDDQDRLVQYGGTTFTHTANGELLTRTAGGSTTSYAYDAPGNLRQVVLPDGKLIEYTTDGAGRRIGKRVNGTLVQGFLYQGSLRPIAELDPSGRVVSRFVYASGAGSPAYMVKDGVTYRFLTDQLGSPRLIVDASTGAVVQRIDYDEFGTITSDTHPGFQPFGFAGGLYDPDTGLTRFGARDYDSATGRWTAKDPILFEGGNTNLYGYVLNDPVNLVDPLGLYWMEIATPIAMAISQVDTPAPGPADLVAGTIIAAAWLADNFPDNSSILMGKIDDNAKVKDILKPESVRLQISNYVY